MSRGVLHILRSTTEPSAFRIARVAHLAITDPNILLEVFEGVHSREPLIALYCAEVIEKVSRLKPERLRGYEDEVLESFASARTVTVKSWLALGLVRLELNEKTRSRTALEIVALVRDESALLKEKALDALAALSKVDRDVQALLVPILQAQIGRFDATLRLKAQNLLVELLRSGSSLSIS